MYQLTSFRKARKQAVARTQGRQAQRTVVRDAYLAFRQKHSCWAAALFDEHFFDHTARPILRGLMEGTESPDPAALASAWAEQLWFDPRSRQDLIAELTPVAGEFLTDVVDGLRSRRGLAAARLQPA